MKKFLLDSDICIHFLKGKYDLKEKIEKAGISNCFLSEITIAELIFGAFNSTNFKKHIEEVKLIEELFTILPIYDCLSKFGEEKARLKKEGNLIPDFDLLIGITAIHHNMNMVTNNVKHLSRLDGIQIDNWVKS